MNNKNDFKATRLEPEEKVRQSFSRIVLAFAAITFAFSILLFLSQSFQVYIRVTYHVDPELVAITLFLASLMTFFMGYLEQDFSIFARSFVLGMQTSKNLRMASSKPINGTEVEVIKNALGEALNIAIAEGRELNPQRNSPTESPNVDRPVIDSHIQRAELGLLADRPISRMKHEIEGMSRRANLNLLIGMAITVFGVYLLWTTVGVVDGSDQLKRIVDDDAASLSKLMKSLALPLVPKVSLVIFIEVFAYFFLRLYKAGLEDIKYFQNELTNMESKFIALEIALLQKNSAAVKSVVDSLAKTERNFVLRKGETTVELERAKADSNFTKEIMRNLPKIFSERSKGKDS